MNEKATIDTDRRRKKIAEKKKNRRKQTNASPQTQQVVLAFCIFVKSKTTNSSGYRLVVTTQNCLCLQKQSSVFALYINVEYIFFRLLLLFLLTLFCHSDIEMNVLVYCWSFVVAKHLTKPIICYREDRLIIGRWQVPTIRFHSVFSLLFGLSHKRIDSLQLIFKNSSSTVDTSIERKKKKEYNRSYG